MPGIDIERLKYLREKHDFTQKYIALCVGVAPSIVSRWENGRKVPSRENLSAIADLFGVTVDYLLGKSQHEIAQTESDLTESEARIVAAFRSFNQQGKEFLLQTIATMEASNIYKKRDNLPNVEAE